MNSIRSYQQSLALMLPVACFLNATSEAQSTWNGGTSADWANAANWAPGIPASGANVIIANTTTNGLTLDGPKSIGSLTFGATGTRATSFTLNTQAANNLAINGGIVANGAFTSAPVTALTMRGHYTVPSAQTWTVAGSNANNTDQGIFIREITTGVTNRGSLILSSDLTKNGAGQLLFAAIDITGPGNLIVDAGGVKYNAGASQPLVIAGPGNITLNNASTLSIYRNSGTMTITRPIVLNGTSTLNTRANSVDVASPIAANGTHNFDAAVTSNLSGALTGAGTITRVGTGTINFSGALSGFSGTLNGATGTTNLQTAFGGVVNVTGGTVGATLGIAGNLTTTTGTANISGGVGGNVVTDGGTANIAGGVTGSVSANGGTTAVAGPIGGTLVLAAAGTLASESTVTGNITLNGGALATSGATVESLSTPGNLELTGTNTINLLAGPPSAAPFTILSYGGTLTGGIANLALAGAADYRSPVFSDSTPGIITLSALSENRTWVGGAAWDINTSLNWLEGDQKFLQLDAVTFTDTGAGSIALTGVVNPLSVTITSDVDYTFTSAGAGNSIAGGGSIVKNGAGTVTLQGANTFSGGITINGGVFKAGGNQSLGANGNLITVNAGASLDTTGTLTTNRDYQAVITGVGGGSGAIVSTGADQQRGFRSVTLAGDATIGGTGRWDMRPITAGTALLDLDGNTLTKIGTNTIAFVDGVISEPGVVNINEGIFAVTRSAVSGTGNFNVNNGATLQLENYTSGSFSKPIALDGSTLRNQGANFTLASDVSVTGNSIISVNTGFTFTVPTAITGTGNLEKADVGALLLTAANTYDGTTKISGGVIQLGNGGTTGSINSNPIELSSTTAGIRFNRSDDQVITNVISGSGLTGNALNPAAVNKDGPNTLTLSAANTYTGTTRAGGGTIAIASDNSVFGDPSALIDLRGSIIRSSDASPRTIPNPISYSVNTAWGSPGTGKLTLSGAINAGGASKSVIINNDEMEISGVISGTGAGTFLTKDGPGKLVFTGDNTYTQITVITQGILQIGNGGTTGTLGSSTVTNNASLVINRTDTSITNVISGTGTLTHSGPGFTILSGANTYTGDTIVTDGTISPSSAYFADTAAVRLSGDGTVDLFHEATDVIDRLYIDGIPQAVGKWGRVGSIVELGADFESPLITGDGLLSVTTSGTPYDEWATDKDLTAGVNDDPTDNPDNDGDNNLTEYALDSDPLSGAASGKVVVKLGSVGGDQVLTLTLPVRTVVGAFSGADALTATGDGVTYTVEGSDDLGSWLLDIDEVTGPDAAAIQSGLTPLSSGDWTYRTFRSPGPVTGDPSEFLRVQID